MKNHTYALEVKGLKKRFKDKSVLRKALYFPY